MMEKLGTVTGFFHSGITVKNIEESLKFYCDIFGLELLVRQNIDKD
jgi:lactoylglutathione lyase